MIHVAQNQLNLSGFFFKQHRIFGGAKKQRILKEMSFAPNTPIIVKHKTSNDMKVYSMKDLGGINLPEWQIWSHLGWTDILAIHEKPLATERNRIQCIGNNHNLVMGIP